MTLARLRSSLGLLSRCRCAKVRRCLDVFEKMLAEHKFDFDRPLTGLEIELNLVDENWQPDMANARVLAAIADPAYQTELGQNNIELNVPPQPLTGDSLLDREALRSLPTPTPLIDRTIDQHSVVVLAGYWGTCKSVIAQDWSACVATGKSRHGRAVANGAALAAAEAWA